MRCSKCSSEQVQRLQVIFEGGTHIIQADSTTVVAGSGGGYAVTNTIGTSSSVLAGRCAPPRKKYKLLWLGLAAWAALGTVVATNEALNGSVKPWQKSDPTNWQVALFFVAVLTVALLLFNRGRRFNATQFPAMYNRWQNSWYCHQCGSFFQSS